MDVDGTWNYVYDGENQLVQMTRKTATSDPNDCERLDFAARRRTEFLERLWVTLSFGTDWNGWGGMGTSYYFPGGPDPRSFNIASPPLLDVVRRGTRSGRFNGEALVPAANSDVIHRGPPGHRVGRGTVVRKVKQSEPDVVVYEIRVGHANTNMKDLSEEDWGSMPEQDRVIYIGCCMDDLNSRVPRGRRIRGVPSGLGTPEESEEMVRRLELGLPRKSGH